MTNGATPKRSPLALAVLVLLYEAPMHVYRMRQLIRQRGGDELVNVAQPNSLYQTVARLAAGGLIATAEVTADGGRPERTVYRLTKAGSGAMTEWTRQLIAVPSREYPEFPVAVSMLPVLTSDDALRQLEIRIDALRCEVDRIGHRLKTLGALPRVFRIEFEYLVAQRSAEQAWVEQIARELRSGKLAWNGDSVRRAIIDLGSADENA